MNVQTRNGDDPKYVQTLQVYTRVARRSLWAGPQLRCRLYIFFIRSSVFTLNLNSHK